MIGSNDLATRDFRQQELLSNFRELSLGLLAAGTEVVRIWHIPSRIRLRPSDVPLQCYRRRRQLANLKLKNKFRVDPVACVSCPTAVLLGRDGVHPSDGGWDNICVMVGRLL